MKEYRIQLDEIEFTNLCKRGFILVSDEMDNKIEFNFYTKEIRELIYNGVVQKNTSNSVYNFRLNIQNREMPKEIVKRSPIYSGLYYENDI